MYQSHLADTWQCHADNWRQAGRQDESYRQVVVGGSQVQVAETQKAKTEGERATSQIGRTERMRIGRMREWVGIGRMGICRADEEVRCRWGGGREGRTPAEQKREQVSKWLGQVIWKGGKFRGHLEDGCKIREPGFNFTVIKQKRIKLVVMFNFICLASNCAVQSWSLHPLKQTSSSPSLSVLHI